MARRLSSIFGFAKDDSSDLVHPVHGPDSHNVHAEFLHGLPQVAKMPKDKTLTKSASSLNLTSADLALPLPPLVTDMGVRPVSRGSRRSSRADSVDTGSYGTRDSSTSRPSTPTYLGIPDPNSPKLPTINKLAKKKSWLPTKSEKSRRRSDDTTTTEAWITGASEHIPYDITPLLTGKVVYELWDESGDVDVYLFPRASGRGPSFRVHSAIFADSEVLSQKISNSSQYADDKHITDSSETTQFNATFGSLTMQENSMAIARKPIAKSQATHVRSYSQPMSTTQKKVIYLPLDFEGDCSLPDAVPKGEDIELLVLYRNLIAFLNEGILVSTSRQCDHYAIFMGIGSLLRHLQFGNQKHSSWGPIPWASFTKYTQELGLADVRQSKEKAVEAIVLGEAMRSWPLYNEGFVHAVGQLDEIRQSKCSRLARVSPITLNRLERAHIDLQARITAVRSKLNNFDFPMVFSGLANSQTATEARLVHFKAWRLAFMDFRTFIINLYKTKYGSWPPRAGSKKNAFEEDGLNRLVLREVYQDFTDLYDMLVDRQSLTTRSGTMQGLDSNARSGSSETIQHTLRLIESELDRSVPPVLPSIPFDVPLLPALANSFNREHKLTAKDPQAKKLKENDVTALLLGSYNRESLKPSSLCQMFLERERKLGVGKTVQEMVDSRCGQWLFIYAVLQALPMTVVDARDLRFSEGCENFLCVGPRGGRPWLKEDRSRSRAWYNVASGAGIISLPADVIDHSVEGVYRRSHCWQAATKWAEQLALTSNLQTHESAQSAESSEQISSEFVPYGTSTITAQPTWLTAPTVDTERRSSQGSINFGLEEVTHSAPSRAQPGKIVNPNITFDNILGDMPQKGKRNNKKK